MPFQPVSSLAPRFDLLEVNQSGTINFNMKERVGAIRYKGAGGDIYPAAGWGESPDLKETARVYLNKGKVLSQEDYGVVLRAMAKAILSEYQISATEALTCVRTLLDKSVPIRQVPNPDGSSSLTTTLQEIEPNRVRSQFQGLP